MNLRKTFILGLVAAISAFIIYRYEAGREEHSPRSPLAGTSALSALEIERNGETFRFVFNSTSEASSKSAGLGGLEHAELDSDRVEALLSAIRHFETGDIVFSVDEWETEHLEPLGLSPAEVTLTLEYKQKRQKVSFGDFNSFLGKRYVKLDPVGSVYLTEGEQLYSIVNNSRDFFRNSRPVKFSDIEVQNLTIESNGYQVEIVADEAEKLKWYIGGPTFFRASDEKVSELMTDLRTLRAFKFYDPTPEFFAGTPLLTVMIDFKPEFERDALQISFYRHEDNSVVFGVSGKDEYFQMMRDPEELFKPAVNDLRVKRFVDFDPARVTRARYSGRLVDELVLEQEGQGWLVNGKEGDDLFVEQVIHNLVELEASGYPGENEQEFGFEDPAVEIILTSGEEVLLNLLVGKSIKGTEEFYARLRENPEVFIISSHSLRRVAPREETLLIQPDYGEP